MVRGLPSRQAEEDPPVVRFLGLLLVDALETIAAGRGSPASREARHWVCAPSEEVYSFEHACNTFGLPPHALRRRIGLRAQVARRRTARGWLRPPGR